MPIKRGSSQKVISSNIKELVTSKPGATRAKGIATLAAKTGMTVEEAKRRQAIAIAMDKVGKHKKG